jgi:hypothetical protein
MKKNKQYKKYYKTFVYFGLSKYFKRNGMKKIAFIMAVSLLTMTFTNCASPQKRIGNKLSQTYIGMNMSEFHKVFPKKELVQMENNITIYLVR